MATYSDRLLVVIDATSAGAVQEMDKLQKETKKTDTAFDSLGKKIGVTGQTLKAGLVAGAAALVGTQLVSFLQDSVDAFADAAKGASDLAAATGSDVETVSRFTAAMQDAGVSADEAAGLLTKFTTNAGKNADAIEGLGVTLTRNADGTVDYAASMVDVVDAIGDVGDASKRNQLLVQFFGRQGAQAFQDLYNSGIDLSEAMEAINRHRVFTAEDVSKAMAYDDAMDRVGASVQQVQFMLGRTLVPIISAAADAFAALLEIVSVVPTEVYILVGAAVALNTVLKSQLVASVIPSVVTGMQVMAASVLSPRLGFQLLGAAAVAAGNTVKAAFLSNPVGIVLALVGTAVGFLVSANQDAQEALKNTVLEMRDMEAAGVTTADALNQLAWDMLANGDASIGMGESVESAVDRIKNGIEGASEAMGDYEIATASANEAQDDLNVLLASGESSVQELQTAVQEAAESQHEKNQIDETAKGLMDAYAASTWDAVDANLALFDETFAASAAQRDFNDAIRDYNAAAAEGFETDDDRQASLDGIAESALDAAAAEAERARVADEANGIYNTADYYNQIMIDNLKELAAQPGLPQEVIDTLNGFITTLETAQTTATDGVPVEVSVEGAQAAGDDLDTVAAPRNTPVKIDVTNPREASTQIDRATVPRIAKVAIDVYNTGEASTQIDRATAPRVSYVWLNVQNVDGASSQINAATAPRVSQVLINITNAWQASEMLDYVARRRTAIIEVDVQGQERATRILNSLTRAAGPAAATAATTTATAPVVNNNWSITVNGAADPNRVVRAIDRWTRDNGRREKVTVTA